MFAAASQLKQRLDRGDAGRLAPARVPGTLPRALLVLTTGAILAASLAVIGAPLWLSACLGALAGLRVAAWSGARGRNAAPAARRPAPRPPVRRARPSVRRGEHGRVRA
jgi:hypothetical protein